MNKDMCPVCEYPIRVITLADGEEVEFCNDCKLILGTVEVY